MSIVLLLLHLEESRFARNVQPGDETLACGPPPPRARRRQRHRQSRPRPRPPTARVGSRGRGSRARGVRVVVRGRRDIVTRVARCRSDPRRRDRPVFWRWSSALSLFSFPERAALVHHLHGTPGARAAYRSPTHPLCGPPPSALARRRRRRAALCGQSRASACRQAPSVPCGNPADAAPGEGKAGGGVEKGAWPYRSARAFADAARTRAARANARVHAALQVRFREVAAGALRELLLLHTVHVGLRRAGTGVATRRSGETADGRGSGQAAGERRRPSRAHERGAPQCSRTRLHRGGALPTVVERKAAALRWSRLRLAARRHRLRRHLGDYLTTRVTTRRSTLSLLTTPPRLLMRGHHESITVASLTQTMETFHRRHTVFVCAFETHDSSEGRPAWRARR